MEKIGEKHMKILFVAARKTNGRFSPFVEEQRTALTEKGIVVQEYAHMAHGIVRYIVEIPKLRAKIKKYKPDVIHAHFGLTGLMVCIAKIGMRVPVVVTYHGCDINDKKLRPFSRLSMILAEWNIFVSKRQMITAYGNEKRAEKVKKGCVIPCGINTKIFDKQYVDEKWYDARFGVKENVLFAGSFNSIVKNPKLAKETVAIYNQRYSDTPISLLELRGYTREQVVTLMYKCKALLLTSIREGSPQVIKEAMACGCPVVSVDVGDVAERVKGLSGCFVVSSYEPEKIAEALHKAVISKEKTEGRAKLLADGLDNEQIAQRLINIYEQVSNK